MVTKKPFSEAQALEQYRVALENAESQPKIAATMAEFDYPAETITEGKNLLAQTRQAYDANKTEDDETSAAYNDFKVKRTLLADIYSLDRKKAKVIFRNDPLTLEKLGINGSIPQAYVKWLEKTRKFYTEALADTDIQTKLARLKVTVEKLNAANTLIPGVESARTVYLREKGESQDATQTKDAAFARMDDWMSEFYAVARIAMEDKPQLLETLGLLVRN
jgi:hypothetical protein